MAAEQPKSISIVYEKKVDAQTFPVSGAYGGPTPDNMGIATHFFIEYGAVPHSTEITIGTDNKFHPNSGEDIKRGDIVRQVQATAYMSPETAILIGNWLIEKANLLQKRREESSGGSIE